MKEKKTTKLVCQITGKTLLAAKAYYQKKVEKAGSEEALHQLYVCKDAKDLLKKGYNIEQVQDKLKSRNDDCTLTEDHIKSIVGNSSLRINNIGEEKLSIIKTDPEVTKFIKNITRND